jgi:hypothetical protein
MWREKNRKKKVVGAKPEVNKLHAPLREGRFTERIPKTSMNVFFSL